LRGIEAGALQLPIIENKGFGLIIFEEQLAIIGLTHRVINQRLRPFTVKAGLIEKQLIGLGEIGHTNTP
jgi:hypothetical protein